MIVHEYWKDLCGFMWILRLNDMRSPKVEITDNVARSEDPDKLKQWMDLERVAPYRDEFFLHDLLPMSQEKPLPKEWHKVFRKGGPLEWYNDPYSGFGQGIVNVGSEEDWMNDAVLSYRSLAGSIYSVE